jgi:diguanylate cyclase
VKLASKAKGYKQLMKLETIREKPLLLIVDDYKATLLMLRKRLQQYGFDVVEAQNGLEALGMFQQYEPDMVIMDIDMPVMDGLTACRNIKKMPSGQSTPVLVFTGAEDDKSVEYAFEAGAGDFITKPVNWEELRHRIRRLLYLRKMEETVQRQAYYDVLTNLPNRLLFQDRLTVALQQAEKENLSLAVLLINFKGFKYINDAFGYTEGDILLKTIAERIAGCLDESITLARMGGDRFALFLPDGKLSQEAARHASIILDKVSSPWLVSDHEIPLNCHIGIAISPGDANTGQTLLANAETAMYQAASKPGSAYHFYNREMNARILDRLTIENNLFKALERNELILYYQPLISLASNKIIGFEALLRWQSVEHGFMSPQSFIPLAEATGLIIPFGNWVLGEACKWCRSIQLSNLDPVTVSVNLSTLQFQQSNLVDSIAGLLENIGLNPRWIKLEITESMAMDNLAHTISVLYAFNRLGVKISIDDFGTGYSCLSHLKNLPLNELKIDKSFIDDLAGNPQDRVLVESIVALGKGLKLELVAEGVETAEQLSVLREIKCDTVQGYYFSKPVTGKEAEDMIKQQSKH